MSAADVEVFLDLRDWRQPVAQAREFIELWGRIERAMDRQTLAPGRVHRVGLGDGDVRVMLARARPGVAPVISPDIRFRIVNVLEAPTLREPCTVCARNGVATHGAFRCPSCPDTPQSRRCADHVEILDGALIATCDRHRPKCAECAQAATFRCPGPRCGNRTAHCARHRVTHTQQPDLAYCPTCFAEGFPSCSVSGCHNIGAVPCELTDDRLQRCGVRMCALHLGRWQIYGVERLGLALCPRHQLGLPRSTPEQLVRQIVVGSYLRATERRDAEPVPTLQAFAHTLRNQGHAQFALDYRRIHRTIVTLADGVGRAGGAEGLATMLRERDKGHDPAENRSNGGRDADARVSRPRIRRSWQDELREIGDDDKAGQQLVERLRRLIRDQYGRQGERLAGALSLAEYKKPQTINNEQRAGLLFVRVPPDQQQLFRRGQTWFSQQLSTVEERGVQVQIDRSDRGGKR